MFQLIYEPSIILSEKVRIYFVIYNEMMNVGGDHYYTDSHLIFFLDEIISSTYEIKLSNKKFHGISSV